jgi:hypothetical protein
MEGQAQFVSQRASEGEIAVSFFAAQAVVEMGDVKHQAQLRVPLRQGEQQGHGVGASGETHSQTKSGAEQRQIDGQP